MPGGKSLPCSTAWSEVSRPVRWPNGLRRLILLAALLPVLHAQPAMREGVISYISDPLTAPRNVTGKVRVTLWVSSDASSADFTAKLIDVYPDGYAALARRCNPHPEVEVGTGTDRYHRTRLHQQPVRSRTPHPRGYFQQQFSQARTRHQSRARHYLPRCASLVLSRTIGPCEVKTTVRLTAG